MNCRNCNSDKVILFHDIEYKNKLEGIKKTDTIFYIAKVD